MRKETRLHLWHYLILVVILSFGLFLFVFYKANPQSQFLLSILISSLYFLWGISHHYSEGDLHPKVVVEYLVIAILAIVLLRGVIFR